jgi:hypothetical protein
MFKTGLTLLVSLSTLVRTLLQLLVLAYLLENITISTVLSQTSLTSAPAMDLDAIRPMKSLKKRS